MNRKVLSTIISITLMLGNGTFAQSLKNTFYADGSISLSKIKGATLTSTHSETASFGLMPNIGYFITEKIVAGVGFDYQYSKTEETQTQWLPNRIPTHSSYTYLSKRLAPAIFAKYVHGINERLFWAVKVGYFYGLERTRLEESSQNNAVFSNSWFENKTSVSNISLSPELLFLVSKSFGLQANFNGLDITTSSGKSISNTRKNTSYSLNFNPPNWNFGAFWLIGKGHQRADIR